MRNCSTRDRRLSGGHITLIVVALCATLAPTAVYAAERMISIIGDPYNSSAMARVSEDGRLGVRGEATTQQGLPSNEWHAALSSAADDFVLLHSAPPGSGIGLSQITGSWNRRGTHMVTRVAWTASEAACPRTLPALTASYTMLYDLSEVIGPDRTGIGSKQAVFPVPLTVPPLSDKNLCLYAWGFVWTSDGRKEMYLTANGIGGAPTPAFAPAKGQPSTTAGGQTGEEPREEEQ